MMELDITKDNIKERGRLLHENTKATPGLVKKLDEPKKLDYGDL